MPSSNYCIFHRNGVPPHAQGSLFCQKGCPACEEKVALGLVSYDDPLPTVVNKEWRRRRKQLGKTLQALKASGGLR